MVGDAFSAFNPIYGQGMTDRVMDAIPYEEGVRRVFLDVNHLMRPAADLMSPPIFWRVLRHALRLKHKNKCEPAADRAQSVT